MTGSEKTWESWAQADGSSLSGRRGADWPSTSAAALGAGAAASSGLPGIDLHSGWRPSDRGAWALTSVSTAGTGL